MALTSLQWPFLAAAFIIGPLEAFCTGVTLFVLFPQAEAAQTAPVATTPLPTSESFQRGIVTLTFDDGLLSQYDHALPLLVEAGISATFYVSTDILYKSTHAYMRQQHVLVLEAAGQEIGAHTKSHADLTRLPSLTQIREEVNDSREILLSLGVQSVATLAYPFGNYNDAVEQTVESAGFAAARGVESGFNTPAADRFALKAGKVETGTTFETVKKWIDTAASSGSWLILLFHDIEPMDELMRKGKNHGTTPEILQQIVSYLKDERASGALEIKTVGDTVAHMQ